LARARLVQSFQDREDLQLQGEGVTTEEQRKRKRRKR
jgi:hypothetical protein